jgi:hypothetical protein
MIMYAGLTIKAKAKVSQSVCSTLPHLLLGQWHVTEQFLAVNTTNRLIASTFKKKTK